MPSNAPTVSRGSGRAGLGRPEASEVEAPGPASRCFAAQLRLHRRPMRPARRRLRPWLGMVSLLTPTDGGGGRRGAGNRRSRARPSRLLRRRVSLGAAAPETAVPVPELLPPARLRLVLQTTGLSASAPRPRPPSGSAGEEETWLPPGDNARQNLGSTSRRARSRAVPPPALPQTARHPPNPAPRFAGSGSTYPLL